MRFALAGLIMISIASAQLLQLERVDPELRAAIAREGLTAKFPVEITLKNQPQGQISETARNEADVRLRPLRDQYREMANNRPTASTELRVARQFLDNATLEVAQTIGDRIEATIRPQQDRMEAMLIGLGADEIVRVRAVNMLVANIPGSALAALEAESDVTRISLMKPANVAANAAEVDLEQMSTSAFWNALYLGNGESVAAMDTGLHTAHKHFASLTLDNSRIHVPAASCAANDLTGDDQNGHGTSVASIVTGAGTVAGALADGIPAATVGLQRRSVAPFSGSNGGTFYSLKVACMRLVPNALYPLAFGSYSDALSAAAVGSTTLKPIPVKIFNLSVGASNAAEDDSVAQAFDKIVDENQVAIAVAAGNDGPVYEDPVTHVKTFKVNSPAIAYNVISVANLNVATLTADPQSSGGPTVGGRHKPDLAAPGYNTITAKTSTTDQYKAFGGTSAAAPHISGALALLYEFGVGDPLAAKALLINSAHEALAGQAFAGWDPLLGWGYADLQQAFNQASIAKKKPTDTPCVSPGNPTPSGCFDGAIGLTDSFKFYRGSSAGNFKATLVWNRQIATNPAGALTPRLRNLDLYVYRLVNGSVAGASSSTSLIDNVEQVSSVPGGDMVVKVRALGDAFRIEPFALASTDALTPANGPNVNLTCREGVPVAGKITMTCTAVNQGDLPIAGLIATLTWNDGTAGASAGPINLAEFGVAGNTNSAITLTGSVPAKAPTGSGKYTIALVGSVYDEQWSWTYSGDIFGDECTQGTYAVPNSQGVGNDIKSVAFRIVAPQNCSWKVDPAYVVPNWITISSASGTGTGAVQLSLSAIPPNAARTAAIPIVAGGSQAALIKVSVADVPGLPFTVTGTVTNPNGIPIVGATVSFGGGVAAVQTDAAGVFSQTKIPPGPTYTATVSLQGYTFTANNISFAGATSIPFTGTSKFTASGMVTNLSGKPMAGVTMTFVTTNASVNRSAPPPVVTDATGHWTQSALEVGTKYAVAPSKPASAAFNPPSAALSVTNLAVNFVDQTTFNINGSVVTKTGAPVPGATIAFTADYGPSPAWVTTGAGGTWAQIGFVPGTNYTVRVSGAGLTYPQATYSVSQVGEPLIFTGTAPFTVSGKVTSAAGLAVGGITITFTSQQDGAPPSPATTKADGTWSASGFEAYTIYVVSPSGTNAAFNRKYTFTQPQATFTGQPGSISFAMTLLVPVSGTVVNLRGQPISLATITFARPDGGSVPAPIRSAKATGTWQGIFEYGPSIKYTASAALAHYTFAKTSPFQAGATGIKIIGTPDPFTASGKVTFAVNVDPSRVNLNITGATIAGFTIHPAKDGTWSQAGFESDQSYTVTPVLSGYTFSPSSLPITLTNNTNLNFQGNQGK